jgi:hypothetical protein
VAKEKGGRPLGVMWSYLYIKLVGRQIDCEVPKALIVNITEALHGTS